MTLMNLNDYRVAFGFRPFNCYLLNVFLYYVYYWL